MRRTPFQTSVPKNMSEYAIKRKKKKKKRTILLFSFQTKLSEV